MLYSFSGTVNYLLTCKTQIKQKNKTVKIYFLPFRL